MGAIAGFLAGKKTNTVIVGDKPDIQKLKEVLMLAKASKLQLETAQAALREAKLKHKSALKQRDEFARITGIFLPDKFLSGDTKLFEEILKNALKSNTKR